MKRGYIRGTGRFNPPRVVTNAELAGMFDTSDEWITKRTGIKERRFVEPGTGTSDIALRASEEAMKSAGMEKEEIELIILATLSPDYYFPGTACILQEKLGLPGIPCLDVRQQCTGFIYSLAIADAFIRMELARNILVVGAEVHSAGLDFTDRGRDLAVLFGDGAGAVVVSPSEEDRGLLGHCLHADGTYAKELWMEFPSSLRRPMIDHEILNEGRHFPKMNGRVVFRWAVIRMSEAIDDILKNSGVSIDEVKWIIPHQANQRITEGVITQIGIPPEKVVNNIQRYGNTTAASIPIALDEINRGSGLERGDLVLLVAFGSGFTWGSTLLRW